MLNFKVGYLLGKPFFNVGFLLFGLLLSSSLFYSSVSRE
jgi:hypothetical protein